MGEGVNDWVIHVGLNLDKVVSGKHKIDKVLEGIERREQKVAASIRGSSSAALSLDRKRAQIRRQILDLQKKGASDSEIKSLQNRLNAAKSIAKMEEIGLDTYKKKNGLIAQENKISKETAKVKNKAINQDLLQSRKLTAIGLANTTRRLSKRLGLPDTSSGFKAEVQAAKDFNEVLKVQNKIREHNAKLREKDVDFIDRNKAERLRRSQRAPTMRKHVLREVALGQMTTGTTLGARLGMMSQVGDVKRAQQEVDILTRKAERLAAAFQRVGTKASLNRLIAQQKTLSRQMVDARSKVVALNREFGQQGFLASRLGASMRNLGAGYLSVFTAMSGAGGFFRIGKEFQSIEARMTLASGGMQQMGKDMKWVTNLARINGQALLETANGYAKFGAATSASGFSIGEQKEMFKQITEINTAMQLTPADAKLANMAIEQMVS